MTKWLTDMDARETPYLIANTLEQLASDWQPTEAEITQMVDDPRTIIKKIASHVTRADCKRILVSMGDTRQVYELDNAVSRFLFAK